MGQEYLALVKLVDEKYTELVCYIHQIKCGSTVDFDKVINLINEIHKDEMCFINGLREKELTEPRTKLEIPKFMIKQAKKG